MKTTTRIAIGLAALLTASAWAQLVDKTLAPNTANVGIAKSLQDEIGAGRGDMRAPESSIFIIKRDPFRSVRARASVVPAKVHALAGTGCK